MTPLKTFMKSSLIPGLCNFFSFFLCYLLGDLKNINKNTCTVLSVESALITDWHAHVRIQVLNMHT